MSSPRLPVRSQSFNGNNPFGGSFSKSFTCSIPRTGSGTSRKDKEEIRDRCAELDADRKKRNQQTLDKKLSKDRNVSRTTSNGSSGSLLTARSVGSRAKKRYSTNVDTLHVQIDKLKAKIKFLEDERNSEKTQLMHFHRVVHALQHIPTPKTPPPESALLKSLQNIKPLPPSTISTGDSNKHVVSEESYDLQNGGNSNSTLEDDSTHHSRSTMDNDPSGAALLQALGAMKKQVESLEETHQKLLVTSKEQQEKIASLQQDNELKDAKIKICEQWIRDNQDAKNEKSESQSPLNNGIRPRSRKDQDLDGMHRAQMMRSPGAMTKRSLRPPIRKPPVSQAKLTEALTPKSVVREGVTRMRSFTKISGEDLVTSPPPRSVRRMKVTIGIGPEGGSEATYNGPINEKNQPHGFGTLRFSNGDTYLGDLEHGKMHGKGNLYITRDGEKVVQRGSFDQNVFVGDGVVASSDVDSANVAADPASPGGLSMAEVPLSPDASPGGDRVDMTNFMSTPPFNPKSLSQNMASPSSTSTVSIPGPPPISPKTPVTPDGTPRSSNRRSSGWLERQISPSGKARMNRSIKGLKGHFSFS